MNTRTESQALRISKLKDEVEALKRNHDANKKILVEFRDQIDKRDCILVQTRDLLEVLNKFVDVFDKAPK